MRGGEKDRRTENTVPSGVAELITATDETWAGEDVICLGAAEYRLSNLICLGGPWGGQKKRSSDLLVSPSQSASATIAGNHPLQASPTGRRLGGAH